MGLFIIKPHPNLAGQHRFPFVCLYVLAYKVNISNYLNTSIL